MDKKLALVISLGTNHSMFLAHPCKFEKIFLLDNNEAYIPYPELFRIRWSSSQPKRVKKETIPNIAVIPVILTSYLYFS
jgi:hypothetical protein